LNSTAGYAEFLQIFRRDEKAKLTTKNIIFDTISNFKHEPITVKA